MIEVDWAKAMMELAKQQPHPDWLLERYQEQMREAVRNGGRSTDDTCHEIFRRFAMMTMLSQYDEGLVKDIIWNPELTAEDYLDYDYAIEMQKVKEDKQNDIQST
ncbi:hypothetical protein EFM54_05765 [Lentilactobacillus buchneri]|uniref:hypothetical protein n=1 Tax=Lentilactobacillus buchneri TaxID=1581 RepID=UPI0021A3D5D0|nr:hypothetical protein [Lentilactobacillus buchneri]MCT2898508.1 hypothetical protein [Lentilactobacillus buchneri]